MAQLSQQEKSDLIQFALDQGFDVVKVASADLGKLPGERLEAFLAAGYHGDMDWLENRKTWRKNPKNLWPEAQSALVLGLNYGPHTDPRVLADHADKGIISVYARGKDYHDVIKKRLKRIARHMVATIGGDVKVFVDTAPVMEKPLAQAAGLGWQGKHTNLLSREFGSWLFLGVILTTAEIAPDAAETGSCGNCTACLEACPTQAFTAPYQLDASRCISYLTIETRDHIPRHLRPALGNRIYGCDDCLAACPWNKFASEASEMAFWAKEELNAPDLIDLVRLDDPSFRELFRGSPVKRLGRNRFVRNVIIALGNSGLDHAVKDLELHLQDVSPIVRVAAVWALGQLISIKRFQQLYDREYGKEPDEAVRQEWQISRDELETGRKKV
ncbi:tRNA epoxyqueuosine(34) reductase QueG [Sneathiella limimaris]|uniref:tRNA epoxyqueuosine(34) reductase QueG n=1 Tax=Sneathiella limimaris TaxID=1964213 RepID=UPI00146E4479|nr:tRNA epoxyqueuosine(34) reductase QueG [Sneathiella limimaris]